MEEEVIQVAETPFVYMNMRQWLTVIGSGALVGLLSWSLSLLLDQVVFRGLLCHETLMQCDASTQYATSTADIVAMGIGVFFLVRMQVYRPLLVGLCVLASLWGLFSIVSTFSTLMAGLIFVCLFGISYVLFAWIARIRLFLTALLVMVVLIVIARLVLNS